MTVDSYSCLVQNVNSHYLLHNSRAGASNGAIIPCQSEWFQCQWISAINSVLLQHVWSCGLLISVCRELNGSTVSWTLSTRRHSHFYDCLLTSPHAHPESWFSLSVSDVNCFLREETIIIYTKLLSWLSGKSSEMAFLSLLHADNVRWIQKNNTVIQMRS